MGYALWVIRVPTVEFPSGKHVFRHDDDGLFDNLSKFDQKHCNSRLVLTTHRDRLEFNGRLSYMALCTQVHTMEVFK